MTTRIALLDHGYLELVESWGSDERIIEAARMSTQKGFEGWGPVCKRCGERKDINEPSTSWCTVGEDATGLLEYVDHSWAPGDEKLLKYLYENKHATPFEMAGMVIEVQAPIFVFREWHRHRTQSYNEQSARYSPLPDLNYLPTVERLMRNSTGFNKQAGTIKGAEILTEANAEAFRAILKIRYEDAQATYDWALNAGVPKELARIHLPVARYSRMRASANLRNWLAFLTLRMDSKAQEEIRVYADALGTLIAEKFPRTWELF